MKNIIKTLLLALLIVSFVACEDQDKDPYEINIEDGPFGSFIRLDITTSPVLDVTDIDNTSFGGTLSNPSDNVSEYLIRVRRVSGGAASDYAAYENYTSFPAEFVVTAASLATALGQTVADFLPGDRFDFEATSVSDEGVIVSFDDFAPNLAGNPGMAQGYRFNTFISCPFVQADAVGSYTTTVSGFGGLPAGNVFEVIAGGDSGQIIMVNPHGSADPDGVGYEIEVDVSPFGIATVPSGQFIFDTDETGNAGFFDTTVENGVGFVFSCAGAITLSMDYDLVQMGSGGNFTFGSAIAYAAQKN